MLNCQTLIFYGTNSNHDYYSRSGAVKAVSGQQILFMLGQQGVLQERLYAKGMLSLSYYVMKWKSIEKVI